MNDELNKIAEEAANELAIAIGLDPQGSKTGTAISIIQVACEKAYEQGRTDCEREIYDLNKPAHAGERKNWGKRVICGQEHDLVNDAVHPVVESRAAQASEELIDAIVGDLVRETNIFPNQVERAKQILRKRLMVKKKAVDAGLKKVEK